MKLTTENIKKIIDEHKETVNTDFDEQYRDELNAPDDQPIADAIMECVFESPDFNIGFEQGYIRGMEMLLAESKETIIV